MRLKLREVKLEPLSDSVERAAERALGVVAENVLADCTSYIPHDSGALKASGRTRIETEHAFVEWGGDSDTGRYASRQYYDTSLSHKTVQNALYSPNAQAKWFEAVKVERSNAWQQMYESIVKGNLR